MLGEAATIIIVVTVILGTLAIVCTGLRIYCRHLQKLPLGLDDYLVVIALFLSTGINIVSDYVAATTGVGDPSYVPTLDTLIFALKCNFASENANIVCIGIIKVSILLFYRRIFVQDWFRRANAILIALVSLFTLSILLATIFCKWPVSAQWDPMVPYRANIAAILISFAALNMVFDILTLTLPLIALHRLQLTSQKKTILSTLFTLGSLCIIASILRLYYGIKYTKQKQTGASLFEVPFIFNSLWANVESPAFIIAACLLSFGPLYNFPRGPSKYFSSLRSLLRGSHRSSSSLDKNATSEAQEIRKTITVVSAASNDVYDSRETHGLHWELINDSSKAEAPSMSSLEGKISR